MPKKRKTGLEKAKEKQESEQRQKRHTEAAEEILEGSVLICLIVLKADSNKKNRAFALDYLMHNIEMFREGTNARRLTDEEEVEFLNKISLIWKHKEMIEVQYSSMLSKINLEKEYFPKGIRFRQ